MQRALNFDESPALSVAFRFFLNVPVFLLLAALALAWQAGSGGAYTRWSPAILAVVHLFTLGVLASAMLGAMMQILPVAARIRVLHPRITATLVHAGLTLGTASLALGFGTGRRIFHVTAVSLLVAAFSTFLVAVVGGLIRDWSRKSAGSAEILVAVRLALLALVITLALGFFMAGLRGDIWSLGPTTACAWLARLPDIHAVWGLVGWVGLLIVGVSYQVIPIFQATEIYPRPITSFLAPLIFLLLTILTAVPAGLSGPSAPAASFAQSVVASLLATAYFMYAATTRRLLRHRKRPAPEPTTWFWRTAMISLAAAAVTGIALMWQPWLGWPDSVLDRTQILLGTLLIPGFAVSAVNGMLYKIVPFLLWHNAQRRAPMAVPFMPKVRQFIDERNAMLQFIAHGCAVTLLVLSCFFPLLLGLASIILAASAGLLAWNMGKAIVLYLQTCRRIDTALASMHS